ncbi:MBL fold metallo-hydrolase [Pasteurellaceae bacterium LIM206]|nr:MBL fold metallo-hydrolase [Pasteurellaceae bacterium LIM206]
MKLSRILTALSLGLTLSHAALADVEYQHIRNATAKIHYGGSTFLVDPYLAEKGAYAGFEGTVNSQKRNPLIEMKQPAKDVIAGVDAVIVTHTHDDHWDKAAQNLLPKDLPIFVQNTGDAKIIRSQGFKDVRVMGNHTAFGKVKLTRVKGGQHGTDEMYSVPQVAEVAGDAMGVVMQADNEKSLYVVGDTIWNGAVDQALAQFKPEIVVMNTGYAQLQGFDGSLIMGKDDVAKMHQTAPNAEIITVHMDAVNHATVTSNEMRKFVAENGLKKVAVPKEGDVLKY